MFALVAGASRELLAVRPPVASRTDAMTIGRTPPSDFPGIADVKTFLVESGARASVKKWRAMSNPRVVARRRNDEIQLMICERETGGPSAACIPLCPLNHARAGTCVRIKQ